MMIFLSTILVFISLSPSNGSEEIEMLIVEERSHIEPNLVLVFNIIVNINPPVRVDKMSLNFLDCCIIPRIDGEELGDPLSALVLFNHKSTRRWIFETKFE